MTSPDLPPPRFSQRSARTPEQPINYLIASAMGNPDLVSLAAGLVDEPALPATDVGRIVSEIMADPASAQAALQYGATRGLAALREELVRHIERLEGLSADEMGFGPDDVIVTSGSQQALYLAAEVLLDPGDIVIAAAPSYFVYTGALASFQARVVTVAMDDQGMCPESLRATLARIREQGELHRVKLIYCTSYYQNPTGLTLSEGRRPLLLDIARLFSVHHRIYLVEDAAYRELCYDGSPPRSIKSYERGNRQVILAQTFSKPFAPGLKTGYAVMPPEVLQLALNFKANHDFGSTNLCQHILLRALRDGSYQRHVHELRRLYRQKRNLMLAALEKYMPRRPGVSWTRPGGGLYVWVTLPAGCDCSRQGPLFERCLRNGVIYVPGDYCFAVAPGESAPLNHMRLSFGHVRAERIESGVARLAEGVARLLESATVSAER